MCKRVCVLQRLCVKMFVCKRACLTPPEHLFGGWLSSPPFSGIYIYIHMRSRHLSALPSLHLQISHLQSFTSANPYIFTPLHLQILRPDVFVFCLLCCEAAPCCLLPWHRDGWQQKRAWQTQKIHIDRTHIFLSLSFLLLSLNLLCLFRTYQYIQVYNTCACMHASF